MEISTRAKPFRHWLIDGVLSAETIKAELDAMQSVKEWVRYENDAERKQTCAGTGPLFVALRSWTWLAFLEQLTGIGGLMADDSQYGGGLHVSEAGGFLGCHLDFSLHPKTGLERRLNLVAYLNDCAGGETQLWDDEARNVARTVEPNAGRILLWECSETSYHGTAPVEGDEPRITAAVYYYTQPRPGASPRRRALFVPVRK